MLCTHRNVEELHIPSRIMGVCNQAGEQASWVYFAIGFRQLRIPLVYSPCYLFSLFPLIFSMVVFIWHGVLFSDWVDLVRAGWSLTSALTMFIICLLGWYWRWNHIEYGPAFPHNVFYVTRAFSQH